MICNCDFNVLFCNFWSVLLVKKTQNKTKLSYILTSSYFFHTAENSLYFCEIQNISHEVNQAQLKFWRKKTYTIIFFPIIKPVFNNLNVHQFECNIWPLEAQLSLPYAHMSE